VVTDYRKTDWLQIKGRQSVAVVTNCRKTVGYIGYKLKVNSQLYWLKIKGSHLQWLQIRGSQLHWLQIKGRQSITVVTNCRKSVTLVTN